MENELKPRVLLPHKIFPEVLAYLEKFVDYEIGVMEGDISKETIKEKIGNKEGILPLLVDTIDREVMDAAPHLKIIANCAVGFNNIDIDYAKKKGILVTNTPGVLTETTADLTWALILAVARRIPQAEVYTRAKKYKGWALDLFLGTELSGKCLGIVGMGRIGKAVASKAKAFDMEVVYTDRHRLEHEEEKQYQAKFLSLDDLLGLADVVTLHTTLNSETIHLISSNELEKMKNTAILVNVSRGPIVDEKALAEALQEEKIWGAGLDVYEHEPEIHPLLFDLDNVILLPHIGSATLETRLKMAKMAATNLVQGLKGKEPDNRVV